MTSKVVSIEKTLQPQFISSSCISAPNTFNKSAAVSKSTTDSRHSFQILFRYLGIAYDTFFNISYTICVTKRVSDIGRFETFS